MSCSDDEAIHAEDGLGNGGARGFASSRYIHDSSRLVISRASTQPQSSGEKPSILFVRKLAFMMSGFSPVSSMRFQHEKNGGQYCNGSFS